MGDTPATATGRVCARIVDCDGARGKRHPRSNTFTVLNVRSFTKRAANLWNKRLPPAPAMVFSPMTRYSSYSAAPYRLPTVQSTLEVQYRQVLDLRERVRKAEIADTQRPRIEAFMSGAKVERGDNDPARR